MKKNEQTHKVRLASYMIVCMCMENADLLAVYDVQYTNILTYSNEGTVTFKHNTIQKKIDFIN